MFSSSVAKTQTTPKRSFTPSELQNYVEKVQSRLNSPMEVGKVSLNFTCVLLQIQFEWSLLMSILQSLLLSCLFKKTHFFCPWCKILNVLHFKKCNFYSLTLDKIFV